jgi:hypothetical protein
MLPPASQAKSTQFMKPATEPGSGQRQQGIRVHEPCEAGQDFNETSSKSITFVPSRGPKLPWQ